MFDALEHEVAWGKLDRTRDQIEEQFHQQLPQKPSKLARADSPNIDFAYKFAAKNSQSPVSVFSGVKHFIFVCWIIIYAISPDEMITYRH